MRVFGLVHSPCRCPCELISGIKNMKEISTTERGMLLARVVSTLYANGFSASEILDAGIYELIHDNNQEFLSESDASNLSQ